MWFGSPERPSLGWLSHRADTAVGSGILVAPPTGYSYACSHRPLRALAERLADAGHTVLRIDYDGTGDSAGDQWEVDRVWAWRNTIHDGVAELRKLGAEQLTLVGARLGATLALLEASALEADRVVAWLPVARGRRYAKELRLLSEIVPHGADPMGRRGTRLVAGHVFSDQTIHDIAELSLTNLVTPPAASVLVIDDHAGASSDAVDRLLAVGTAVQRTVIAACDDVLDTPPEYARPYDRVVSEAAAWIGAPPRRNADALPPDPPSDARFGWRGGVVREEVVVLEPSGHVAVVTSPADLPAHGSTLVLLNPGSESHVGPGRAWVEYARDLALAGRQTIRVDFLGWGESPNGGRTPGRPYDPGCVPDTVAIVTELRERGWDRVTICGLCASAWVALEAGRQIAVDGIIAINPQLYWKPGDPVEIDWDLIRARRVREIARIAWGRRLGLWSALDLVGRRRHRVDRWLDELAATDNGVELIFSEADDGLAYLDHRHGRHLRRLQSGDRIFVHEVPSVDHPMHRAWLRPRITEALERSLRRIDAAADRRRLASA